jgi:hypothetical protein
MVMSFFPAFGVTKMLQRMSPFLALSVTSRQCNNLLLSGEERTLRNEHVA